ncbi:MAG: hypothetical protein GF398_08445 [Chitinivibrionales bacterium]|nr:hypothetical protein [Chitinivibrionales bacterium]
MNRLIAIAMALFTAQAAAVDDSLVVEPESLTTQDSITFRLFNADLCCCTQYYNDTVLVEDTLIYLVYEYDESPCSVCRCFGPGSRLSFDLRPIDAGSYDVYKMESRYCPPGHACIAVAPHMAKLGRIAVLPANATDTGLSKPSGKSLKPAKAHDHRTVYDLQGRNITAQHSLNDLKRSISRQNRIEVYLIENEHEQKPVQRVLIHE